MESLLQKVSYLKGLAEGLGVSASTNEGRIIVGIMDVLDQIVDSLSGLEASHADLNEYVESIDQDVQDLEETVYGGDDCCDDDCDDEDDYDDDDDDEDYDEDDDDVDYIEVECPHCHETVYFDEEVFDDDDEVTCPNCNKSVIIEDEDDDDDDDDDDRNVKGK